MPDANVRYLAPDRLVESFLGLGSSMAVTTGTFEYPASCGTADLDWNHMDQHHRPCIHHTYTHASRIAMGRDFALSLTRSGPFGSFVQVTDIRLGPGRFYQGFTLFGVMYVHCILDNPVVEGRDPIKITWHIVSHRLLKFLHPFIDRRLRKLNVVQNGEDEEIRVRRAELRAKGFTFTSDEPTFLSSNDLTRNVRPPTLSRPIEFPLASVKTGTISAVSSGDVDLVVRRDNEGGVAVWPGVCPHEGGPLVCGNADGDTIECPWHGLKFAALSLTPNRPRGLLGDWEVVLQDTALVVQQKAVSA